jgi:primosomal protein N'
LLFGPLSAHGVRILCPAPSPIARVKRRFRCRIPLVIPCDVPVKDLFPALLRPLGERVRTSGVRLDADVDSYPMMV